MSGFEKIISIMLGVILTGAGIFDLILVLVINGWILVPFFILVIVSGIWLVVVGIRMSDKIKEASIKPQFCSKCGSPTRWIAERYRYWCDTCQKYL